MPNLPSGLLPIVSQTRLQNLSSEKSQQEPIDPTIDCYHGVPDAQMIPYDKIAYEAQLQSLTSLEFPVQPRTPYPSLVIEDNANRDQQDTINSSDEVSGKTVGRPVKTVGVKDRPLALRSSSSVTSSERPTTSISSDSPRQYKLGNIAARAIWIQRFFNALRRKISKKRTSDVFLGVSTRTISMTSIEEVSPSRAFNYKGHDTIESGNEYVRVVSVQSNNTSMDYLPQRVEKPLTRLPIPLLIPGSSKDFLPSEATYVVTPDVTPVTGTGANSERPQNTVADALNPSLTNNAPCRSNFVTRAAFLPDNKSVVQTQPLLSQDATDIAPFLVMGNNFPSPPTSPVKLYKKHKPPKPPSLQTHGLLRDERTKGEKIREFISRSASPIQWLSRSSSPAPSTEGLERKRQNRTNTLVFEEVQLLSQNKVSELTTLLAKAERKGGRDQEDREKSEKSTSTETRGSVSMVPISISFAGTTEKQPMDMRPKFLPLLPLESEDWRN